MARTTKIIESTSGTLQIWRQNKIVVAMSACVSKKAIGDFKINLRDETGELYGVDIRDLYSIQANGDEPILIDTQSQTEVIIILDSIFFCQGSSVIPDTEIFALWDTTGDSVPDPSPVAVLLPDSSGSYRAAQMYLESDMTTPITSGTVTLVASSELGGAGTVFGTFTGDFGDNLTDPSKWVTTTDIFNFFSLLSTVGHLNIIYFAKKDFAIDQGFIDASAVEIYLTLTISANGETSSNPSNSLHLELINEPGAFASPQDIASSGNELYIAEFTNFASSATGITQWFLDQAYTTRNPTDFVATPNNAPFATSVQVDNQEGNLVLYFGEPGNASPDPTGTIYRMASLGLDSNGYNLFGPKELVVFINSPTTTLGFCALDQLELGRPDILSFSSGDFFWLSSWAGSSYDNFSIPSDNINDFVGGMSRVNQTVYCAGTSFFPAAFNGLKAATYTGDPKVPGAFTFRDMVINAGSGPIDGNGQTGSIDGSYSLVADPTQVIEGFAVCYIFNKDNHVVQKSQKIVASTFGDERDFLVEVIAGTGTPGDADGIGLAAQFNTPTGGTIVGNFIVITEGSPSNKIRIMDKTTLQVITVKGQENVAAKLIYTTS